MSKYDVDSGIAASIEPKCEGLLKALRGKSLDLTKTGHKEINFLVKAITCQAKASGKGAKELAQYELCHKSVMGTGSFKGQPSCGDYLTKLLGAVCQHGSNSQRPGGPWQSCPPGLEAPSHFCWAPGQSLAAAQP